MGTYELVKGGLSMDKCEEKAIAKKFFETEMGKLFLNKVLASRNLEKQIIKLNQKVHELEYQNEIINKEMIQEETERKDMVNHALSLYHANMAPEYLFDISKEDGTAQAFYTTDIDKSLKSIISEDLIESVDCQ